MKIKLSEHAQELTTTLNLLKIAGACPSRYEHLVKHLGGIKFDHNKPINLLTILETNGLNDFLWALRATVESCNKVASLMAADFAEAALPIFESKYPNDQQPRKAIEAARQCALGEITYARAACAARAARAASTAAYASAAAYASTAAYAAGADGGVGAAYAAARAGAYAAYAADAAADAARAAAAAAAAGGADGEADANASAAYADDAAADAADAAAGSARAAVAADAASRASDAADAAAEAYAAARAAQVAIVKSYLLLVRLPCPKM